MLTSILIKLTSFLVNLTLIPFYLLPGGGDADLDAGVTVLGQLAGQEFVQLGAEDSIGDKLPFLRNLGCHFSFYGGRGCGKGRIFHFKF